MTRWTTEAFQELIGMWLREESLEAIAAHFDVTQRAINHVVQRLRRNGIALPLRRRGHKAGRRNKPWTQEEIETLVRMRNERATTQEIANALDRTFYGAQAMLFLLRNGEGVPIESLGHGRRRLWDAERLRASVAGRGLSPLRVLKESA